MKYYFLILAFCFSANLFGQFDTTRVEGNNLIALKAAEDTLKNYADSIIMARSEAARVQACYTFLKGFARSLRTENSFYYYFDSLRPVSMLYPEDSSFRIMTWQLELNPNEFKYFGAIQLKSSEIKLFPLADRSAKLEKPEKKVFDTKEWYGALYYSVKQVDHPEIGRYYLLFGLDSYGYFSKRKLIDVLTFENGKPSFGAPVLNIGKHKLNRFIVDYYSGGNISMNYNELYGLIIFDHLIEVASRHGMIKVTDGSYEGFKEQDGEWNFVEKVFNDFQEEAPRPVPVLKNKKNIGIFGEKIREHKGPR